MAGSDAGACRKWSTDWLIKEVPLLVLLDSLLRSSQRVGRMETHVSAVRRREAGLPTSEECSRRWM